MEINRILEETTLLSDVKEHLKITWDEEETNSAIKSIIKDAIPTLNFKLGADIDYSISGMEHRLFLNYCLYAWNDCLNEFDNYYLNEIYQIRSKYEVEYYEENQV